MRSRARSAVEADGGDRDGVDLGVDGDRDDAGSAATTGDGRPTRLVGSGRAPPTRPSSTSSADEGGDGRAVEPVTAVSRARESGPSRCTRPSTLERLRRCTPSKVPLGLPRVHSRCGRAGPRRRAEFVALDAKSSATYIRHVQITFDVEVETFERFNDEQTQHHEARHARVPRPGSRSASLTGVQRRRREATMRGRRRHPHLVAQRHHRPPPQGLGGGGHRVRSGAPRRHRRADRLPERGPAAHAHPERPRTPATRRTSSRCGPAASLRDQVENGYLHAARRRDRGRHDRERRRDREPLAGRRRALRRPVHLRHRGLLVQHRPVRAGGHRRAARRRSTSSARRREAQGRGHRPDRRRRGRQVAGGALVVPVRAALLLARDAGRPPRPSSTSATSASVEAGEELEDFLAIEPFQEGFLGTSAQQGAGSSAGLVANGQAAMELMGHWNAGVIGGLTPDQKPPEFLGWFPSPASTAPDGDPTRSLGGGDGYGCSRRGAEGVRRAPRRTS